jgi:hypothetical protein
MEHKLLQRQLMESSIYYASEQRRYRKLKTNVFLTVTIVGIAISLRLTNNPSISNINDSTRQQQYFDIPPHQAGSRFKLAQIA